MFGVGIVVAECARQELRANVQTVLDDLKTSVATAREVSGFIHPFVTVGICADCVLLELFLSKAAI